MDYVYVHPEGQPYGGPEWRDIMRRGRLDLSVGGELYKVAVEGDHQIIRSVPGDAVTASQLRQHNWLPRNEVIVDPQEMVERAAQRALAAKKAEDEAARMRALAEEDLAEVKKKAAEVMAPKPTAVEQMDASAKPKK